MNFESIDWLNPDCPVSRYFKVKEAIYLPQWKRLANGDDGLDDKVKFALWFFFNAKMDVVRSFLAKPINVHVSYRPRAYNILPTIDGAPNSAHLCEGYWGACDFDVEGISCDHARALFEPNLDEWKVRMERRPPGSPWVHLDSKPVPPGGARYFNV